MAKTKTKRPAPKPARKTTSTALARRPKVTPAPRRVAAKVDAEGDGGPVLTLGVALAEFALVEVKLTKAEETILAEDVPRDRVEIKPTGTPYLPHTEYRRWLNRAFGRLGWALRPAAMPAIAEKQVVAPYILHIHGRPVAFAWGAQDYFPNNKDQTYDDALEATQAYALRRCMKHIGVGLELWDRDWLDTWRAEYAIQVQVKPKKGAQDQRPKRQWRRSDRPRLWGEVGRAGRDQDDDDEGEQPAQQREARYDPAPPRQEPRDEGPSGHHANANDKITDGQLRRFHAIVRNSGRLDQEVRDWLHDRFRLTSSKDITRRNYDYICSAIEAQGELPKGGQR